MPFSALPAGEEDRLLLRHILDLKARHEKTGRVIYSNFLDDRQLAICETALKSDKTEDFTTLGGYENAERRVISFGVPEPWDKLPFSAAVFNYPEEYGLTHRDFLGSLMALGIKRELLGDILVGKGRTAVFVINTAVPLVFEMKKIGRVGVSVSDDFSEEDIPKQEFEEIRSTVSSLRLDSVTATALRLSRDKAQELIRQKGVSRNRVITYQPDLKVSSGDRFSVRGFGKFELSEVGGQSRKDRTIITIKKYK